MKERHFYKKQTLINEINRVKTYPIEQIYMALTQIIDSKEPIVDKYLHPGVLINVDEYYLFQPSELTNNNIGLLERTIPLDIKPREIHLDLRTDIALNPELLHPVIGKRNLVKHGEDEDVEDVEDRSDITNGKKVLAEMTANYRLAFTYARESLKVERGENNWYKYCGISMRKMAQQELINTEELSDLLVEHLVDFLAFGDKLDLLNYFYISGNINDDPKSFEHRVYQYLTSFVMDYRDDIFILLFNKEHKMIMMFDKSRHHWIEANEYYSGLLEQVISNKYQFNAATDYNDLFGFIDYDKDSSLIFKTKDKSKGRTTGAKCSDSGKVNAIKRLNEILGGNKFTDANTKGVVQQELCIYQEFILRKNDKLEKEKEKGESKKWFLTLEEANFNGLTKSK